MEKFNQKKIHPSFNGNQSMAGLVSSLSQPPLSKEFKVNMIHCIILRSLSQSQRLVCF